VEGDPSLAASGAVPAVPPGRGFEWLYRFERWLAERQIGWLNRSPYAVPRFWRAVFSHHRARVDLTLRPGEADIALNALERQGWQHVATAENDVGDGPLTTLIFTVLIPSGYGGTAGPLARALTVALADARVRDVHHYTIDPTQPDYQTLPEWRKAPPPEEPGTGERPSRPDRAVARAQRRAAGFRVFGDVSAAAMPPPPRAPDPASAGPLYSGLEPVGTVTDRLHRVVAAFAGAVSKDLARVATGAAGVVVVLLSLVLAQVAGSRAPAAAGEQLYLWIHVPKLGLILLGATAIWGTAAATAKLAGDRLGAGPHTVSLLSGAMAVGVFAGGLARQQVSLGALLGLVVFALIGVVWKLAERVKWRLLAVGLRVTTVAVVFAAIAAYGRARLILYYAGMGVHASEVDTAGFDTFTVAARPILTAAFTVAVLLVLAWIASGHWIRFAGVLTTIIALLTGAALLLGPLGADERRGRLVGAGLAHASSGGLRFDPAPTAVCLTSLAPDPSRALTEALPRRVWRIGAFGQQTLLLDPTTAKASHKDLPADAAAQVTYVPEHNVAAPVLYVPTSQLTLRPAESGAPC
jgi:hypothetical protein